MRPYIFGNRGDIYIIDLKQTLDGLDAAYTFASDLTRKGRHPAVRGHQKGSGGPSPKA